MSASSIISKIDEVLSRSKSVILCTIIEKEGSGPRELGSKMLVTQDGEIQGTIGGGGMERIIVKEALESLKEGKPRILHFAMGVPPRENMIPIDSKCGGEVKIFLDPIKPDPRLIIMGSGLIAQAVTRYASECDFKVIIIDDAKTATKENFPNAETINAPYPKSLEFIDIYPTDFVAILHGETQFELSALRHVLKTKPSYIGLLGSVNKARSHKNQLLLECYDQETVKNIHAPIGIEIKAETPEEIAISILAELIKVRSEKR